jgi:hypothetical protein
MSRRSAKVPSGLVWAALQFVSGAGGNPARVRSAAGLRAGDLLDPDRLLDIEWLSTTLAAAADDPEVLLFHRRADQRWCCAVARRTGRTGFLITAQLRTKTFRRKADATATRWTSLRILDAALPPGAALRSSGDDTWAGSGPAAPRVRSPSPRAGVSHRLPRPHQPPPRDPALRLAHQRLPEGAVKARILRAITSATPALPLAVILRILGLPGSRYHAWRRADTVCGLEDRSSCPRITPGQITAVEIADIKDMVIAPHYRHMPLSTLSLYAQRIGKVFASPTTWARLARERGWRRPRLRVHPDKPTVGVRATRPDEIWHIDVTVVRLLNGVRVYIHAVIDNFSRKILAWTLAARLDPTTTCAVLVAAGRHLDPVAVRPTLMADSGVEHVNAAVDATLLTTCIRRVLAQVDITR